MVGNTGIKTSLIIFAIFLASAGLALWAASGEDIWHQLGLLSLMQFAALLGLSLANYALRGLRWWLYTDALKLSMRLFQVMRHYIGGFALTMTPARLGEAIRMRWIARETGAKLETLAPLILVDRAGDLASTGLLLAFSLAMGASGVAGGLPVALLAVIVAIIVTRPTLFTAFINASYRVIGVKPRLFVRMRRAAKALRPFSTPKILSLALIAGGLGWFAEGYAFHLLLGWMGANVSLWTAISIFLFAMMTGGATGMPGGIGGAEAAMIGLLSLEGVPLEISIPATAIIRITTLWFAIGLGVAVFPLAEGIAARTHNALENS
ncbi:MAG: flippase-like domain-containing protein [Alphaproteobacteria bacterium]|nr:flippase-like domain-containing protein [Alphaproteobacteria bacterium]